MNMSEDIKNQPDKQLVPMRPEAAAASKAVVPYKEVKSVAEVKHGIVHFVTPLTQLSLHTDLNIPPSNWLRGSSKLERHVRDLTWHSSRKPSQFSSIDMAHNSPDLMGDVDVVAHASNIKKLLKIPFEKSHVSMMVHRVGRSLLLDEFDIHKHLLRKEQNEWGWLKQFYYEYVQRDLHESMKCVPRPSKSRDHLQNRNLYSKFLYHSLCDAESEVSMVDKQLVSTDDATMVPVNLPKPRGSQTHRDVLWTFEDIKMLIGTDLPVFRDESYYVSLRLKDMRTPINVVTGLDYWLDNLMCNVPEVAMCFHIDGIVQKYEVIKTEDIPRLENSKFDPGVVTDIAKNILSFLKNNATKEGHTYWLYKGTDDDVVKLYDLTALCADTDDQSEQNPFTVPLGMLLYRVARNMWTNQTPGKASLMRTLLENCLYLLDEAKHPQVCTSATYLLSDIFVPDSTLDDDWSLPGNNSEEDSDEESGQDSESGDERTMNSVDVKCLSKSGSVKRSTELMRLRPITETEHERCQEAVKFINKGLVCLERDYSLGAHTHSNLVEEQAKCNSDEAIPLHYEPIQKPSASQAFDLQMTSVTSEDEGQTKGQSWHILSKGLLYRKAAYTFLAMSKQSVADNNYLDSFKYLKLAFSCFSVLKKTLPHKARENDALLSSLYGILGDTRLALLKSQQLPLDWDSIWKTSPEEEIGLMELADNEIETSEYAVWFDLSGEMVVLLRDCVECYEKSVQFTNKKNEHIYIPLVKRKGNAWNELGVFLMQSAQKALEVSDLQDKSVSEMNHLWTQAGKAFDSGIAVFEDVRDIANQALLHCNCGRLMRLIAQTYTSLALKGNQQEFTLKEREFYNKAIDKYKKALHLGNHGFKNIVESVKWELSTTYFNMAALLQDYAPLSSVEKEEVENEIVNLMYQSLKFCNKDCPSFASQTMYQFRAATINHRLASLFHNSLRDENHDQKRRYLRTLSEKHYIRALALYLQMECHVEFLRAQLEYIALIDLCLSGQGNPRGQLKLLLQMLHSLLDCQVSLRSLALQLSDTDAATSLVQEGETITSIVESKIQFTLLQLVKVYKVILLKKSTSKDGKQKIEELKSLYAASLSQDKSEHTCRTVQGRLSFLQTLLEQVSNFYHKSLAKDLE